MESSEIEQFYNGRSVFMTGASGFLGKVILEKLLRDCPGLKNVYVLVRPKQGQVARRRVEELVNSVVFQRLQKKNPDVLRKIVAVSGDVTFPGLGIKQADLAAIKENVSVVFHSAATIRFDEPLKRAVDINVAGTRRVLELCQKLPNLKALVHVSTAYCNRAKNDIKEVVYHDTDKASKIIDIAEWMDDDLLSSMETHLFNGRPSSYHYTKALAENLLFDEGRAMPIAIVRPSIITAALKEPLEGWTDNYNGPTGYFVVSGKGILRSMYVHSEKICDMIPVDVVANCCICASFAVARDQPTPPSKGPLVINCTSGTLNPISWGRVKNIAAPMLIKHPSMEIFRYPGTTFYSNKQLHLLNVFVEHTIPAQIVDFIFKITGHTPIMSQVYQKVHRSIDALEYFTTNEWCYRCDNFRQLCESLSEEDRKKFYCDVRQIHWPTYIEKFILGVREHLLKEKPMTLPRARQRLQRIYYMILMAKIVIVTGSIHQAYYHYPTIKSYWQRFGRPTLATVLRR